MADVDAWMPLWIGAYLADTMHLSTEQHGAYLLLIMHHWRHGPLPDDDEELATIARLPLPTWKKMRSKIAAFFRVSDGIWAHKRVEQEKSDALGNRQRVASARAKAGKAGAAQKWGSDASGTRADRLKAAREKGTHTEHEWSALLAVCGNKCVQCGSTESLCKDHVTPIYMGGSDGLENVQPLCRSCNSRKGPSTTDHRPRDWRERMAGRANDPGADAGKFAGQPTGNVAGKRLANAWQTPGSTPLPPTTSLRSVADRAREPDPDPPAPSPAGEVCRALRVAGLSQVNPSHPKLLALLEAGAQPRMFVDMAKELLQRAPEKAGFGYVLAAVEGRMRDAATTIRALPAMTPEERSKAERRAAAVERISAENGGAKVEELGDGRFRCAARFYTPEGRRELAI